MRLVLEFHPDAPFLERFCSPLLTPWFYENDEGDFLYQAAFIGQGRGTHQRYRLRRFVEQVAQTAAKSGAPLDEW